MPLPTDHLSTSIYYSRTGFNFELEKLPQPKFHLLRVQSGEKGRRHTLWMAWDGNHDEMVKLGRWIDVLDLSKVATSEEEDEAGVVDLELLRAQLQDLVHLPPDPGRHRQAAGCLIPVYGKEGDGARTCDHPEPPAPDADPVQDSTRRREAGRRRRRRSG